MDTHTYKQRLEEELAKVEGELNTLGVEDPSNPEGWNATASDIEVSNADDNERADKFEELEEHEDILNALKVRWHNIRRALGKIEVGTYGTCEIAGEQIEEDRLNANPSARTCKAHLDEEKELSL